MHDHAYHAVAQLLQLVPVPTRVVEIGSRTVNGSIRPLFAACAYTGVDCRPGPDVDVVADGATYAPAEAPDCVVCCEVLEHAPDAGALVANMARMLAPGGSLLITAAADPRPPHSAVDGGPLQGGEYYQNVAMNALESWLLEAGLRVVDLMHREDRGDLYAAAVKP